MRLQDAHTIALSSLEDFVSSDFEALGSHMRQCERSRSRMASVRSALELVHTVASGRIVTTCALFTACAVVLLSFA
jgi:hypothetical protein